jgi:hypothetical protein
VIVWHEYSRAYRNHHHWTDHLRHNGVAQDWCERDWLSRQKVERFLTKPWFWPGRLRHPAHAQLLRELRRISFRERRLQDYPARPGAAQPAYLSWLGDPNAKWVGLVCLERAALSAGAGQADFWYFGLHDA